jgi:hypothetical protein
MKQTIPIRRLAVIIVILLVLAAGVAWRYGVFSPFLRPLPGNSIMVIVPYRYGGTWVFDDSRAGLVREPFVAGVPEMIDTLVADIPGADRGFRLTFSAKPFPGYQKKLTWLHGDSTGNWYRADDPPMEGWLCPGLFKYYREAPKELYIKAAKKE